MPRSLTAAAAAGLAVLATVATVAPASAARLLTPDSTGDVWKRESPQMFSELGTRTNTDVVGSAVRNADRRVSASVRYDELVPDSDLVVTPVRIHASTGRTYLFRVTTGPDDRDGTARLLRYTGRGAETVRIECAGLQHSVSYDEDLVSVSVPRSCLGSPTWVRYGGTVRTVAQDGTVFTDALLSGDAVNDLYSDRIERG